MQHQPRDEPRDVSQANQRMRAARQTGQELLEELGERSAYRATQSAAVRHNISEENVRRFRIVARRLSAEEVEAICEFCKQRERAIGPSFLVAFSRIRHKRERTALWQRAVRQRWSLDDVQRELRHRDRRKQETPPQLAAQRRGRKRNVDWTSEVEMLDEIGRLCRTWERFAAELDEDAGQLPGKAGLNLLTKAVRDEFRKLTSQSARLQQSVRKRLEKLAEQPR